MLSLKNSLFIVLCITTFVCFTGFETTSIQKNDVYINKKIEAVSGPIIHLAHAENDLPIFSIEDCNCGITGLYLKTEKLGNNHSLSCYYTPVDDPDSFLSFIKFGIVSFSDEEKARNSLEIIFKQHFYDDEKNRADKNELEIIEDIVTENKISIITRRNPSNPKGNESTYNYRVYRRLLYGDTSTINIEARWPIKGTGPSDAQMISIIEALEACAKNAYDRQANKQTQITSRLTLEGKPIKHIILYPTDSEDKKTTTDENGKFTLNLHDTENFNFSIDFQYVINNHIYFNLLSAKEGKSYKHYFTVEKGKIVKISLDNGVKTYDIINLDYEITDEIRLENLFNVDKGEAFCLFNYIHVSEALEFYRDELNVNFDHNTLEVDLGRGSSAGYSYKDDRNYIWLEKELAWHTHEYQPFIMYHEFTHYVHHILTGESFEQYLSDGNINHGGYANPSTGDSFSEGLAAFMPVVIANYYDRYWADDIEKSASGYPLAGSLDVNWNAWEKSGRLEEIAVAGVLWDLFDGSDEIQQDKTSNENRFRKIVEELFIKDHDVDGDGVLNRVEFYTLAILQSDANQGLHSYLDTEDIKEVASNLTHDETELDNMIEHITSYGTGKISTGEVYLIEADLYRFVSENIDYIEASFKQDLGDKYDDLPMEFSVEFFFQGIEDMQDDDNIDLELDQLWTILKKPHSDFTSVYEDLISTYPSQKENIDAIFITHGFFVETSAGNGSYDKGEPYQDVDKDGEWTNTDTLVELYADLGEMNYDVGEIIGSAANADRKGRKSFAPFPGEFIRVNDDIPFFALSYLLVDYEYFGVYLPSRMYVIRASNVDSLIYVPMPSDAFVIVEADGVETVNPMVVGSDVFEANIDDALEQGYFVEHEFEVVGEVPEFPVDVFEIVEDSTEDAGSSISVNNRIPGFDLEAVVVSILIVIFIMRKIDITM